MAASVRSSAWQGLLLLAGNPLQMQPPCLCPPLAVPTPARPTPAGDGEHIPFGYLVPPFLLSCRPDFRLAAVDALERLVRVGPASDESRLAVAGVASSRNVGEPEGPSPQGTPAPLPATSSPEGPVGTRLPSGDHLGIGGTQGDRGKSFLFNGNRKDQLLVGKRELPTRTWHHVVLVRDGPKVRIYLDGKLEGQGAAEMSRSCLMRPTRPGVPSLPWPGLAGCAALRKSFPWNGGTSTG
jgi:hypothetical protein